MITGLQFSVQPAAAFLPNEVGCWSGVPEDVYHAAPGASNSSLRLLSENPRRYRLTRDGKLKPARATRDQLLGTAIHSVVNEGKNPSYHLRPDFYGPEKKPWNGNATECKVWLARHQDLPILKADDVAMLKAVALCCKEDARACRLLKSAIFEVTACARNEDLDAPYLLRCRPDIFGFDADGYYFVETKSTRDASTHVFAREVYNRYYHVQVALYHRILCRLTGGLVRPYIWAIEKDAEIPRSNLRQMSQAAIDAGGKVLDERLRLLHRCELSRTWPALPDYEPGDLIPYIDLPEYAYGDVEDLEGLTEAKETE